MSRLSISTQTTRAARLEAAASGIGPTLATERSRIRAAVSMSDYWRLRAARAEARLKMRSRRAR